jgi:hypothetical protein
MGKWGLYNEGPIPPSPKAEHFFRGIGSKLAVFGIFSQSIFYRHFELMSQ